MNLPAGRLARCHRKLALSRSRLARCLTGMITVLRKLGPYAAIELLLPGGTLIAVTLWVCRSRGWLPHGNSMTATSLFRHRARHGALTPSATVQVA
jgi:hypothetical protein